MTRKLIAIVAIVLVTGCATVSDSGSADKTKKVTGGSLVGTALGASVGAAVGEALGSGTAGALIGGVVGGVIGGRIAYGRWQAAEMRLSQIEGITPIAIDVTNDDSLATVPKGKERLVDAAIGVNNFGFAKHSSEMTPELRVQAVSFAKASQEPAFAKMNIVLVAYTGADRSDTLAVQRAAAYRQVLLDNGVNEARIFVVTPQDQPAGIDVQVAAVNVDSRLDAGWVVR